MADRQITIENRTLANYRRKRCTRCKEVKSFDDFQKNSQGSNGLQAECKQCVYERQTIRIGAKNPRGRQRFSRTEQEALRSEGLKYCASCGEVLAIAEFRADSTKAGGLHCHCFKCNKRRIRMSKFRLTYEQVVELEAVTHCPGCLREFDEVSVKRYFDHCHKSGSFRMVMCRECNLAVGILNESPATMRRLADIFDRVQSVA